jgi:CRISPR/Cas system CMR-associated protein Cmr1 (group 7 of RAMP superfamily)
MPIRGTALRGHLQFWWRATRGAVRATLEELSQTHYLVLIETAANQDFIVDTYKLHENANLAPQKFPI